MIEVAFPSHPADSATNGLVVVLAVGIPPTILDELEEGQHKIYEHDMPKLTTAARRADLAVPGAGGRLTADEIYRVLALTQDPEPHVRQAALMNLCPCHLRSDRPEVWDRVFEMACDADIGVRKQVLHTLGDGSPRRVEDRVVATLESMRHDPDRTLRRHVRSLLAKYRRTGRVNVL